MSIKNGRTTGLETLWHRDDVDARQQVDAFLRAMVSYPERFAHEPEVSFEQHLFSVATHGNVTEAAQNSTR